LTTLPGDAADNSALHHVRISPSGYPFTVRVGANSAGAFNIADAFGGSSTAVLTVGTQQPARATYYYPCARICATNSLSVFPPYDVMAVNVASTNLAAWPVEPSFELQLNDAFGSAQINNRNIRGYLDYATPCYVTRPAPAMRSLISHAAVPYYGFTVESSDPWLDASLAADGAIDFGGYPTPALPSLWKSNATYRAAVSNLFFLYAPLSGSAALQPLTVSNFNAVAAVESQRITRDLTTWSNWSTNGGRQVWLAHSYPYTNFNDWAAAGITWTLAEETTGQYTPGWAWASYGAYGTDYHIWFERRTNVVVVAAGRAPGVDIPVDIATHVYAGAPGFPFAGNPGVFSNATCGAEISTNSFWQFDAAFDFVGNVWTGSFWVIDCPSFPPINDFDEFPRIGSNYGWSASAPQVAARWHFNALTNYSGAAP